MQTLPTPPPSSLNETSELPVFGDRAGFMPQEVADLIWDVRNAARLDKNWWTTMQDDQAPDTQVYMRDKYIVTPLTNWDVQIDWADHDGHHILIFPLGK